MPAPLLHRGRPSPWVLPLLADSDEVTVAGELSPAGLRALSVVTDGEVRAL